MPGTEIQWFPGHMAKTRRMITENLGDVDIVLELRDARIPESSRNPEIFRLTSGKPVLIILNKASLADPDASREWIEFYKQKNLTCLLVDCRTGEGVSSVRSAVRSILSEKVRHWQERGMTGRRIRAMILGIPNVGKSTLINRLCNAKLAKAENRPGVTRDKQWVSADGGYDLLDMPGVLWPKFDSRTVAENLAFTGTIKQDILDNSELAAKLALRLRTVCPSLLFERYRITPEDVAEAMNGYELVELIGRKRGYLVSGGETDLDRASLMLLEEFRNGKIGRITLEKPPLRARETDNA